jgi:hypothetical protein
MPNRGIPLLQDRAFLIPAESEHERGEGFWDEYIAAPSAMHIICQK